MNEKKKLRIETVEPAMVEVLKKKSGAERMAIATGMWRMAREVVERSERRRHPNSSEQETQALVAKRMSHGFV